MMSNNQKVRAYVDAQGCVFSNTIREDAVISAKIHIFVKSIRNNHHG